MTDYVKFLEQENIENKTHIKTLKNPLTGGVFFLFRKKAILNLEKKIKAREEIIKLLNAKIPS